MTSLNSHGFSISLLNVADLDLEESILNFLDASSDVPGWHAVTWPIPGVTTTRYHQTSEGVHQSHTQVEASQVKLKCETGVVIERLRSGLQSVIVSEPEVTEYDNVVGDGDCGTTLKRGAEGHFLTVQPRFDRANWLQAFLI